MTLKSNDAENSALRHRSTRFCNLSLDSVFFIPELKLVDRVLATAAAASLAGATGTFWGTSGCSSALLLLCTSRLVSIGGCGCEEFQLCLTVHSLTHRADTDVLTYIYMRMQLCKTSNLHSGCGRKQNAYPGKPMLGTMRAFQSAVNTKMYF